LVAALGPVLVGALAVADAHERAAGSLDLLRLEHGVELVGVEPGVPLPRFMKAEFDGFRDGATGDIYVLLSCPGVGPAAPGCGPMARVVGDAEADYLAPHFAPAVRPCDRVRQAGDSIHLSTACRRLTLPSGTHRASFCKFAWSKKRTAA